MHADLTPVPHQDNCPAQPWRRAPALRERRTAQLHTASLIACLAISFAYSIQAQAKAEAEPEAPKDVQKHTGTATSDCAQCADGIAQFYTKRQWVYEIPSWYAEREGFDPQDDSVVLRDRWIIHSILRHPGGLEGICSRAAERPCRYRTCAEPNTTCQLVHPINLELLEVDKHTWAPPFGYEVLFRVTCECACIYEPPCPNCTPER